MRQARSVQTLDAEIVRFPEARRTPACGSCFQLEEPRGKLLRLPSPRAPATLSSWRLKKVRAYVHDNLAEPLRLAELAGVAGLSRMYFAAQFRTATGYRPHSYVLHCRVERSKALIQQGAMTLVQIALEVGFQSQAHFCTTFKRFTGVTPTQWWHLTELDLAPRAATTAGVK